MTKAWAWTQRTPWMALLAVFALVLQGLVPGAAMALQAQPGQVEICTAHGLTTVAAAPAGRHDRQHHLAPCCGDCLAPALAAPPPKPFAVPVPRATLISFAPTAARTAVLGRRAPPRPPSTAPPALS